MRCGHCAAALAANAAWCGLCLAPVPAAAAVPAPVLTRVYEPPPPAWPPPMPAPKPESPKAGRTVFAAIAVGAVAQGVSAVASRGAENEAAIRYALVTALGVYAVVAFLLIARRSRATEPLNWRGNGRVATSVLLGLGLGGGLAFFLMSGVESAGQQGGDPRVAILVSEGDVPHILATALITVVAAPLLEELLFRGMLLSSLADHGKRMAIWVSAVAFAAWHLAPSALVYYSLMGALLGGLFVRRGLVCSIATHAAFNGVLTVAAVTYALAPGAVATTGALTVTAPHGWHATRSIYDIHLTGPSAGEIIVVDVPMPGATTDVDLIAQRLADGAIPLASGLAPRLRTLRTERLRAGPAVRVGITFDSRDGELVMLPRTNGVYLVLLASGGSVRARADFDRVVRDLTVAR